MKNLKWEWGGRGVKEKNKGVAAKDDVSPSVIDEPMVNGDGEPSRTKVDFCTLYTPGANGIDMVVLVNSIRAISDRFANTAYGFFLEKRVAYPVVANCVRNTWVKYGLVQWHSDVNLLKEDVSTIPIWVKLYDVHVTAFKEDGLSAIATKPSTPLLLDSYTVDMCMQSWGRSSYARAMIELRADLELKDNIVVAMPKITGEGHYTCNICVEYERKPPRPVPKNPNASSTGNTKKCVEPSIEVSNSNPFEVLNSVENDVELGTNGGTTNLVNNEANSSGSSFMNVDNSSTVTTLIIDKIKKFEDLLSSGQAILVNDVGNCLKKVEFLGDYDSEDEVASVDNDMARSLASEMVGFGTQSLLEQWRDSYGNDDYDEDPYDDDMYEGQDLPQGIQATCDNLDIRVRDKNFTHGITKLSLVPPLAFERGLLLRRRRALVPFLQNHSKSIGLLYGLDKHEKPEVIVEKPVTLSHQHLPIISVDLHLAKEMMMRLMVLLVLVPHLLPPI
uniref:DUF4283 domain-containing protein n=1 Tax=Tanacetum cinerariifolium TaxID=118510 RepID=A0A6L2L2Q2_TANCI|nr:hypothetical protein [Tanacetum cinerariifolium]